MPKPFHELSLEDFTDLVDNFTFTRTIESVHMHHTWRPNHANFAARPPIHSIEGMFNYHTQVNHWSDIAQHITIDPRGMIWTGRDWNRGPASATGFNGNAASGPFMFEMIGDFDDGKDPFDGKQKLAVIGVVAKLLQRFNLPIEALRFHNQMSSKTCPGSAIDRPAFLAEITAARALQSAPRSTSPFPLSTTARSLKSLGIIARWEANSRAIDFSAPGDEAAEDRMNADEVDVITSNASPSALRSRGIFGAGPDFTPAEKQILRPHVINLRLGAFSDGGKFETSLADVQKIFNEHLPAELALRQSEGQPLRIMFYAHGGLVSEEQGIRPILRRLPFWRQNGIYPIFFCWETGLRETFQDLLQSLIGGQRGFISDASDAILEAVAGIGGRQIWGQMKRVAELAALPGGGARVVAEFTRDFWTSHHADMELHALGHSAGSIFHSYFLPTLIEMKPGAGAPPIKLETLHYLAPACTTALFESKLMKWIGPGKPIEKHTMYTMNKDLEKADKAGPYQKSLLYFVSRAFETRQPTPILGLEESLREDPVLIRFYGLSRTVPGQAQILFSDTPASAPLDSSTRSHSHGDFDNEVFTMNSVARRVLDKPGGSIVSFVDETSRNEVTRALNETAPAPERSVTAESGRGTSGNKRALCIGIDTYPAPHALAGCVNDSRDWSSAFQSLGFSVTSLINEQATRAAMLAAMQQLISTSTAGDSIIIQYAGHGTKVKDLDGDEVDGTDEALVPFDFGTGSFLIDDDIRNLMAAIPPGVNVTCFMDCCNSGTNTRIFGVTPETDLKGSRPRFLKMTPDWNAAHVAFRAQMRAGPAPAGRTPGSMREINFAACLPDQVAYETGGSGDFTHRAVPILRDSAARLTNAAFLDKVLGAFGAGARQQPNLDCAPAASGFLLLGATTTQAAPSAGDPLLSRLEAIEKRLAKLGV